MHRYVSLTHDMLKNNFTGLIPNPAEGDTFDESLFGIARAHEYVMSLQWLLEFHPEGNEDMLQEVIGLLFEGAVLGGRDWNAYFSDDRFPKEAKEAYEGPDFGFNHGVNTAEGKCTFYEHPETLTKS